jgi:hypothetical protein
MPPKYWVGRMSAESTQQRPGWPATVVLKGIAAIVPPAPVPETVTWLYNEIDEYAHGQRENANRARSLKL